MDANIPLLTQFAVSDTGKTYDGIPITQAFEHLTQMGADIVGLNCRSGPSGLLRNLKEVNGHFRLSAYPNAGLPDYVDGQYIFPSSVDYFAELGLQMVQTGVRLIGGCCGTTPDHIRALSKALKEYGKTVVHTTDKGISTLHTEHPTVHLDSSPSRKGAPAFDTAENVAEYATMHQNSLWVRQLSDEYGLPIQERVKQKQTIIVELDPPRDLHIAKFMEGAQCLKEAGAAAISMAENSLASTRMSNLSLAHLVQQHIGITAIPHMTCRDRNLIAQQSHLMGLHSLGIEHILAVTGDPTRFGDTPGASSVYDMTSFEMIRMIKLFNQGQSYTGRSLKGATQFNVACALNPNSKHLEQVIKRLEKKIDAGADFVMTQPIYDPHLFEALYAATAHLNVPIFVGIAPLTSYKNALFVHHEVPGYRLSNEVLERMSKYEGEDARKEGMEIAKELLAEAARYFHGIFLMTPFMKYELTAELTLFAKDLVEQEGIA